MYNELIDPRNLPAERKPLPTYGRRPLNELLASGTDGYSWTKGIHLYTELRPVQGLQVAERNETAQKYLRLIEEYAHAGVGAARIFGLDLLELQGTVLHFHKEGALVESTVIQALEFSYVFTKVLYDTLAEEMGDLWHGFAICMDHGDSVIVRKGNSPSSSAISLGPSANEPAKRLLYGRTEAGHAEFPAHWIPIISGEVAQKGWYAVNLRDAAQFPMLNRFENTELERQLRELLAEYRRKRDAEISKGGFSLMQASELIERGRFSTDQPLRMHGLCMRADLDGFSALVRSAFSAGEEQVDRIARDFLKILEFGEYFTTQHYGMVRLPWARDCVTFLIPAAHDIKAFRAGDWVKFVEEWQSFAAGSTEGQRRQWGSVFKGLSWAVGLTYGETGNSLVAAVSAGSRSFLIAAGPPLATANEAQNLGKGGQTVIHTSDHQATHAPLRKLFSKIHGSEFWEGRGITMESVKRNAIELGSSQNASRIDIVETAKTISIPTRPYAR